MKELKELVFSTRGAISVISRSPSPNPQGWGRVNPSLRARTHRARTTGRGGAAQRRRRCENRLCMPPSASVRARGCRVRKMPKMTSAQIMVRDVAMECPEAVSVVASSPAARDTAQFVPPISRRARRRIRLMTACNVRLGDSGQPDARSPSLIVVPASAGSGRRCLPSRPCAPVGRAQARPVARRTVADRPERRRRDGSNFIC